MTDLKLYILIASDLKDLFRGISVKSRIIIKLKCRTFQCFGLSVQGISRLFVLDFKKADD